MTTDNNISKIDKQSKIFFDDTYNKYKDIIDQPLDIMKNIIKFNNNEITESKLISKLKAKLYDVKFSFISDNEGESFELLYLENSTNLNLITIGLIKNSDSTIKDCFLQEISYKNKQINSDLKSRITTTPYTFEVSVESLDNVVYFNYFFKHNSAQTKFPHFSISGSFENYDAEGFPIVKDGATENIFSKYINAARISEKLKEHDINKLMKFFYSGECYTQEECDLFRILNDYDLKDFNKFFLNTETVKLQKKNEI